MTETYSFGEWIAQRRKTLDLSQRELAAQTNCALVTIKKIESDERRPSRDLADALAAALNIPVDLYQKFVECARGLRPVDALAVGNAVRPKTSNTASSSADLPTSSSILIGRDTELAQIDHLLSQPSCRLLTLVGVGGIGKTRLAIEAARAQRYRFTDGAVFVSLATITDASMIPTSIAQSLKLVLSGSAEGQLFAYLHDKSLLLILDNCEQLSEGIGWLSELLANAPGIKLLATSRERLQLTEEWIYTVPLLDETQAFDLFVQTARRVNTQFESSAAVSTVCTLVENLPLALELAASWTPFLSCEQIARNVQQNIDFLTANIRNIPERHRSIRAVFDHSWRLLAAAEQQVMMKLSVFRGGWTVDEAEPIAGANLFILRTLVEKSLIKVIGQGRYDMHELVRQYAADQLKSAGQEAPVRREHALIYLSVADKFDSEIYGPQGIEAFTRLDQEQDNFRAGISWAAEVGELNIARQYIDKLFLYWQRRGHWMEGERWSKAAGPRMDEGDSPLLCWILLHTAVFVALQGRYNEAFLYKPRAMEMALRLEDPETMMRYLMIEGQAALDLPSSAKMWDEFFAIGSSIAVVSKTGKAKEVMIAGGHFLYGDRLRDAGYRDEAIKHYRQSLELYRQVGNVDLIAYPIGNLGRLALQEGRVNEAYKSFSESVAISRAIGNRVGIADWLQQLGNASLTMGDIAQAESCYEEALALYQEMGNQRACPDILADLGYAAFVKKDWEQSKRYLKESLAAYRNFGQTMETFGVGWSAMFPPEFKLCIRTFALLDVVGGNFERAVTLLCAAQTFNSKFGIGADLGMQAHIDTALSTIQSHLSQEAFNLLQEQSSSMSLDQLWRCIADLEEKG